MTTRGQPEAPGEPSTSQRKDEHLQTVLGDGIASTAATGLARWRPRHRALPGIDLADVDTTGEVFGRALASPLLVSCMTGGSPATGAVNRNLALAAEGTGIALGLGSLRAAMEDPSLLPSYAVRDLAPSVALIGNIGVARADPRAVAAVCARLGFDALAVHLNPLQEAVQRGGDASFRGAIDTVRAIVETVEIPVVVKEVGFGLDADDVELLLDAGVAGVDVAGSGGTNWALVEGARRDGRREVAAAFAGWGTPTADALVEAVAVRDRRGSDATVVASGGIADGVDALVALCLGADLVGIGRSWIGPAQQSAEACTEAVATVVDQLRIAWFAVGACTRADLDRSRLRSAGPPPPA